MGVAMSTSQGGSKKINIFISESTDRKLNVTSQLVEVVINFLKSKNDDVEIDGIL